MMAGVRAAAVGGPRQLASSAVGLMLPSSKVYCLREKKVVNMNNNIEKEFESDRVVGSSHGWVGLMKLEKDRARCGSSSGVSLWNPMSGSRMMLPPMHTIIRGHPSCRKLMVDDSECSRAIIVGSAQWLGVCWPGRCSEWTQFGLGKHIKDAVLACSRSRVYTIDRNWEVVRWNVSDPRRPRAEWGKILPHKPRRNSFPQLVYAEQSGQLFLVTRHYYAVGGTDEEVNERDHWNAGMFATKTVAFDVHLVVEDDSDRMEEHSLDGLVMFVGVDSFALPAADFPHLKPDSIYFTDHNCPCNTSVRCFYGGHDIGIYDYKNRTISSCYYPTHRHSYKRIHPTPFWLTT